MTTLRYFPKSDRVSRYNQSVPRGVGSTHRGLTHSTDLTREGLLVHPTRTLPTTRRVSADPHPELSEAVSVSRFWRLVQIGAHDQCWQWLGCTDSDGYGLFVYHGQRRPAHELALSFSTGEVRHKDLDTCHACDNPGCCNPSHLRFDTRQSNVAEMHDRGRAKVDSKLTADEVRLIRERRELGARQQDLADEFGVTAGQISMIVRGIRWPEAGGPIQTERKYRRG